jgi:hypothetical protein
LPDDDAAWMATVNFFGRYGQSLDWVFYGDPVSMIVTSAARSPRGRPAWQTTGIDPVYAAIKRERAAYTAYLATGADQHRISEQNPFPSTKFEDRRAQKKRLASPEHKTWWARYEEVEEAHNQSAQELWLAREAFLQTQPISIAGLIAFIDHVEGPFSSGSAGEAFWDDKERELAFPTLAAAARELIGGRGQT